MNRKFAYIDSQAVRKFTTKEEFDERTWDVMSFMCEDRYESYITSQGLPPLKNICKTLSFHDEKVKCNFVSCPLMNFPKLI